MKDGLTASVRPIRANRCLPLTIFRSTSFNILWQNRTNSSSYCCFLYEYGAFSKSSLASSSCTREHAPRSALVLTNKSWGQNLTRYNLQNWNQEIIHSVFTIITIIILRYSVNKKLLSTVNRRRIPMFYTPPGPPN